MMGELRDQIQVLSDKIREADLWFISNITADDWTERINEYWLNMQKRDDALMKLSRLRNGLPPLKAAPKEYTINHPHKPKNDTHV